jgi:hypothetical protein
VTRALAALRSLCDACESSRARYVRRCDDDVGIAEPLIYEWVAMFEKLESALE